MNSAYYETTTNEIATMLAKAHRETQDEALGELLGFAAKRLADLESDLDNARKGRFPYTRSLQVEHLLNDEYGRPRA